MAVRGRIYLADRRRVSVTVSTMQSKTCADCSDDTEDAAEQFSGLS